MTLAVPSRPCRTRSTFNLGDRRQSDGLSERQHQGTQKRCEPAQEQAEVVAGGGQHGVDAVAVAALEIVTVHAVLGLHVADDGLDGGAALHLATDGGGDAAHLAADPDPELVRVVMAAIALSTWMRRVSMPVSVSISRTTGPSVWPS